VGSRVCYGVWKALRVAIGARIRPAVPDDVEAIRDLVERAYAPWVPIVGLRPGPMDEDYGALVEEGDVFVLGEADTAQGAPGPVIGVLVLRPDEDALMVENVAVDPGQQGRGLGPMLLDFAEEQARARGVAEMRLYTHERMLDNIELYRRLGWEQYERRESDGFARVFMRKAVTSPDR
jgi:ribosomal protein S18 acetylase RimI-like enzyme